MYSRFLVLCIAMLLCSCEKMEQFEHHDPTLKMPAEEYKKQLTAQEEYKTFPEPKPIVMQPVIAAIPASMRRPVTISTTEQVPIKDVFMELARQAKVNIVIDPAISGGVFYQASAQPFSEVIAEICEVAGLRYLVKKNIVRIERDLPYMVTYNVQNLSNVSEKKTRISSDTDVFTAMEGNLRDFDNGSSTLLTNDSKIDFWQELLNSLNTFIDTAPVAEGGLNPISFHKQAGLVSIKATYHQHKKIEDYLNKVQESVGRQVLIEAKIVEVNLFDEFKSGINWHRIKNDFKLNAPLGSLAIPGAFNDELSPEKNAFSIGSGGKTLTSIASVLNTFGTVRTLSSPRITVMNNQTGLMKVATNFVFFKINYFREIRDDEKNDVERASSQIQTVPIGLVMMVHPNIDSANNRITMSVRPTISRVIGEKEDPAVSILSNQQKVSKVPEVQVREMQTTLNIGSGDVIILGGLMEERSDNDRSGLPIAQDAPIFGGLFGSKNNTHSILELVIFLKATIQELPIIQAADKRIYNNFAHDPRPLDLSIGASK